MLSHARPLPEILIPGLLPFTGNPAAFVRDRDRRSSRPAENHRVTKSVHPDILLRAERSKAWVEIAGVRGNVSLTLSDVIPGLADEQYQVRLGIRRAACQ